jgi:hypothetical protein
MKIDDLVIGLVVKLPDFPKLNDNWKLMQNVLYDWEGIDFTNDDNDFLQVNYLGRVRVYSNDLRLIFQSQL